MIDMRGVDLLRYRFDFDVTFSALAMNADGTIYHRYGGRDHRSPDQWLTRPSFARFLRSGLMGHAAHVPSSTPGIPVEPLKIEDIPAFAKRDKGECVHCHSVFPALYEEALAENTWQPDDMWWYPPPARIGIDLARDEQRRITAVAEGSPAGKAGLLPGDELRRVGPYAIATASDLMEALNEAAAGGARLEVGFVRAGEDEQTELVLTEGWKRGDPLSFSWRPFKWGLLPAPGFGGPPMPPAEKRERGLATDVFAFRITYMVTWGENKRFGQEARRAGLREGDVVVSIGGETDFASVDHFHSWWRLTRKVGETVHLVVLRGEKRLEIDVKVIE
ncbi:MAG: PDZ domain-containing protein [bacterium]|nr:PDZ domain-containing protein [bacterium]